MVYRHLAFAGSLAMALCPALGSPHALADGDNNTLIPNNKRLNDGVVANVYTIQQHAGCTNDVRPNPALQHAAQRHANDLMDNRYLDGDIGSDGSTPQQRADAAGFQGPVTETIATNPALAISGVELINQWYYNPADMAIMSNCANSNIGVWSLNSPDRTVVVAVYGHPTGGRPQPALPPGSIANNIPPDPSPDYDASDELEHGVDWFAWILRGISPARGYPPN
ncbi:MAG: CAP domain-containing protein [Actinomycetota bacterium]|uniref:CAP domain-containing protein n=1 Tax=Mycobacterium lentiflavum TaxID=141349 RepID=A0ABY3UNT9_MYCLN|nr:CAP domain-containing protein [Mycobacterium lentiflavum]MEE3062434.1 CAP domain-containing protein [Actinomycetota bacterium]ULP40341.1 CAP domain-containing protein [Mycobacterium lentiflavum]